MSNKYPLLITAAFFSLSVFIYVLVIALLNHATWAVDVSGPIGAAVLTFIGHWIKKLTTPCVPADAGVTVEAAPVEPAAAPVVETPVAVVESAVVAAAPSIFKKLSNIFQPKAPAPAVTVTPAEVPPTV